MSDIPMAPSLRASYRNGGRRIVHRYQRQRKWLATKRLTKQAIYLRADRVAQEALLRSRATKGKRSQS